MVYDFIILALDIWHYDTLLYFHPRNHSHEDPFDPPAVFYQVSLVRVIAHQDNSMFCIRSFTIECA